MLKDGGTLRDTKSALVLEDLIGQFLYKSGDNKDNENRRAPPARAPRQHLLQRNNPERYNTMLKRFLMVALLASRRWRQTQRTPTRAIRTR